MSSYKRIACESSTADPGIGTCTKVGCLGNDIITRKKGALPEVLVFRFEGGSWREPGIDKRIIDIVDHPKCESTLKYRNDRALSNLVCS
jgi:hypothetical protein